jgi:hypothetical protein
LVGAPVTAIPVTLRVPPAINAAVAAGFVKVYVNVAGELVSTVVGATATVMDGGGAKIAAGMVNVCTGAVAVAPNVVSIADSALRGKVKVPVLPGNPVATTVTEMVQVELGKMVGVGCAVSVICVATVKLTALGHVLLIGDGPTT